MLRSLAMKLFRTLAVATATIALIAPIALADTGYRLPPEEVTDIVLRAPSPRTSMSPDGRTLLLQMRESLPPVAELAKPMERLAGLRLDAATNDRHGPRSIVGLTLKDIASETERPVTLPANADIASVSWSPDGRYASFTMTSAVSVGL